MSWEPCPRCQSNKVQTSGKGFMFLLGLMMLGCFFWLGLLFWPLWLGSAVGLVMMVIAPFMPKVNQCQDCNHAWKPVKGSAVHPLK